MTVAVVAAKTPVVAVTVAVLTVVARTVLVIVNVEGWQLAWVISTMELGGATVVVTKSVLVEVQSSP
jgi:hypothetical protein